MSLSSVVSTMGTMQFLAYATPLLSDQTDTSRIALTSCQLGARREAYQDSRRRAGIIREAVWLQSAPAGSLAVVYLEADDLATALRMLATSPEPFDRWFRAHLRDVHGTALDEGFSAPELVLDFDTNRV